MFNFKKLIIGFFKKYLILILHLTIFGFFICLFLYNYYTGVSIVESDLAWKINNLKDISKHPNYENISNLYSIIEKESRMQKLRNDTLYDLSELLNYVQNNNIRNLQEAVLNMGNRRLARRFGLIFADVMEEINTNSYLTNIQICESKIRDIELAISEFKSKIEASKIENRLNIDRLNESNDLEINKLLDSANKKKNFLFKNFIVYGLIMSSILSFSYLFIFHNSQIFQNSIE